MTNVNFGPNLIKGALKLRAELICAGTIFNGCRNLSTAMLQLDGLQDNTYL